MQDVEPEEFAQSVSDKTPEMRAVQEPDPVKALGWAVSYLMTKSTFAALPFGHWARTLVGQINRKHYFFAVRDGIVVGFFGWALTSQDKAEAWLAGGRDLSFEDSKQGDCIVINAWDALDAEAQSFVTEKFRKVIMGKRLIYAKRFYKNGKVRPLKVGVNKFVEGHIKRKEASAEQ